MVSEYISPLDLEYIFINLFAGSREIFMGLFFIVISVLAGIFRMPSQVFVTMIALSGVLLYAWFQGGFYIIILLITGAIVFWNVSRLVKN